jgi:peptide/nickel transport system ATP-binding protein
VLKVKDLRIDIKTDDGILNAVRGVDFQLENGRTLGLVGESGCGKSLTSKSILGINPKNCVSSGKILFEKDNNEFDLLQLKQGGKEIRAIRGSEISMIFQEPMTAFSPMYTIGNQIMENALLHITRKKSEAKKISLYMMDLVGIADCENRFNQYPHEFSGGMLQRALIAMSLICKPSILIADEPTTALDVTIQAQILELMQDIQKELGMSILYITHDLGTVASMCEDVAVMYLGEIVEYGDVVDIFYDPGHPYTKGLLDSIPKIGNKGKPLTSINGIVPVPYDLPPGCGFYNRCEMAIEGVCNEKNIENIDLGNNHFAKCVLCKGGDFK